MELSDHDIKALVTTSAGGDTESCEKLYAHLVDKVYPYVRYRTATDERATDITQDVFIDLFSALSNFTYQTRAQFYAFVFVIAKRKLARHYAEVNVSNGGEIMEFSEQTMSETTTDALDDSSDRLDVLRALSHLDDTAREIVVLHHWARHTFKEIALLVDMEESAVRVRHHRALKVLATKLAE